MQIKSQVMNDGQINSEERCLDFPLTANNRRCNCSLGTRTSGFTLYYTLVAEPAEEVVLKVER